MGNSFDRPVSVRSIAKVQPSHPGEASLGNSLVASKTQGLARGTYIKGDDEASAERRGKRALASFMNDADMDHPRYCEKLWLQQPLEEEKEENNDARWTQQALPGTVPPQDEIKGPSLLALAASKSDLLHPRYDWDACFQQYESRKHIKFSRCNLVACQDTPKGHSRYIVSRHVQQNEPLTRRYGLAIWVQILWEQLHNTIAFEQRPHTNKVATLDIDGCLTKWGIEPWIPAGDQRDVECLHMVRAACKFLSVQELSELTSDKTHDGSRFHGQVAERFLMALDAVRKHQ